MRFESLRVEFSRNADGRAECRAYALDSAGGTHFESMEIDRPETNTDLISAAKVAVANVLHKMETAGVKLLPPKEAT